MEVDSSSVLLDESLLNMLPEVFAAANDALHEEEVREPLPPIALPSIAFILAVYCCSIKNVEPGDNVLEELLIEVKETRDKAKAKLYELTNPTIEMPPDWEPSLLLTSNASVGDKREPVNGYFALSSPDQLRLSRIMAYCAMMFHKKIKDAPASHAKAISTHTLNESYEAWCGLFDTYKTISVSMLVAYYDHLNEFLESPIFHLDLGEVPASYPRPTTDNASRAPVAFLWTLDHYHYIAKTVLAGDQLNIALKPLLEALVVICRDLPSTAMTTITLNASKTDARLKEALTYLQNVEVSGQMKSHFNQMCNVCKSSQMTKKKHYFVGWKEYDMIFRFGWTWRVQPRPQTGKIKNPHAVFASLLASWSKPLKAETRWSVAIQLYKLMIKMCEVAPEPESRKRQMAAQCLPELNFLLPSLPSLTPQMSFLLIVPDLLKATTELVYLQNNSDLTSSTALNQSGTNMAPTTTANGNGMQIDGQNAPIKAKEAVLNKLKWATSLPSLNEVYAAYWQSEYDKMTQQLGVHLPVIQANQPRSNTNVIGRFAHRVTPDADAIEFTTWSKFKSMAQNNFKFNRLLSVLGGLYGAYPDAFLSSLESIVAHSSETPTLLLLLRCAHTWVRIDMPS